MKRTTFLTVVLLSISILSSSQTSHETGNLVLPELKVSSQMGNIISTNNAETVWNAFRFADFDVKEMMNSLVERGGKVFTCVTSAEARGIHNIPQLDRKELSTMNELSDWTLNIDRVLTF